MISRVLVANRGEIAVRLMRGVAEYGAESVAVYSDEDAAALHVRAGDDAVALDGAGAAAYLDGARLIDIARRTGCDALHPGYGFLSENASFAGACAAAGLVFVGPDPSVLERFGDKAAARRAATDAGVAVLPGTDADTDLDTARAFFDHHGPLMVKAVAGGGGRGIRAVTDADALPAAFERCRSEASAAFGSGALYVEKLVARARHVEVQVLGDGAHAVHLGERDCSIQRRNQKLIEFAPSPGLPAAVRERICDAAVRLAESVGYRNAGTFEFLVDCDPLDADSAFAFMEANARLQVEHTVTEEVTGVDLVLAQLELAAGRSLEEIGLADPPAPRGHAVQLRVNLERMTEDGGVLPSGGTLTAFDPYDYTVLAGTQGAQNHRKTDRLIDIAEGGRMPVVLFAEGGGGRPGDTDMVGSGGGRTFSRFAQLSALVPMVGIVSGRCFAGNASLLGCCDVIVATADTNLGMGGPAMIEGGGLGVFAPEDIGPMAVQRPNGVVDLAVADEAGAVAAAKRYLAYFQGALPEWTAPDQRRMRRIVPENRLRVYEIREVIETLADAGSVLELRRDFGDGMVTALVRIEGRSVGVIANNPKHLGGAIDSDGADKGARFMQVCDAFDIPILYLCDTPGIMVGPEIEHTALVRHSSRMFVVGANLSVPFFTVIVRKAYGLGAIAMAGGSYKAPFFSVAWPTGEFGGMGLEGSVKLGFRKDLEAIEDPEERRKAYETMVARAYEQGKALNQASHFGIDDTIDPADTRWWLANLLASIRSTPRSTPRSGKKRPAIDAW